MAKAGVDYPEILITPWGQREILDLFLDLEYHQQRRILGRDLDASLVPRRGLDEVCDMLYALGLVDFDQRTLRRTGRR